MSTIPPEAKRLKLFRKTFGVTQQDVADTIGKSKSLISHYESGTVPMPLDFVKAMHKHYGLNYKWFFEGLGKMKDMEDDKRIRVIDLKAVMADVEAVKAKTDAMDRMLRELHAQFYADRYSGKSR